MNFICKLRGRGFARRPPTWPSRKAYPLLKRKSHLRGAPWRHKGDPRQRVRTNFIKGLLSTGPTSGARCFCWPQPAYNMLHAECGWHCFLRRHPACMTMCSSAQNGKPLRRASAGDRAGASESLHLQACAEMGRKSGESWTEVCLRKKCNTCSRSAYVARKIAPQRCPHHAFFCESGPCLAVEVHPACLCGELAYLSRTGKPLRRAACRKAFGIQP